jgi:hypothetical protein
VGFSPLLPVGRQQLSITELREFCVGKFPLSKTRELIMSGLKQIVDRLLAVKVQGELWIDGSFLTEKIDPNDSDVVLFVQSTFCDGATTEQMQAINWVNGDLKSSHCCDSYVSIEYPQTHPLFWHGEYWKAYWMKQWGFSRDDEMKGIAVVSL